MEKLMTVKNKINSWIDAHKKKIDVVVACILALIPILQHYSGIIDNAATTCWLVIAPYLFLRIFLSYKIEKHKNISLVIVLALFFVYKLIDHGTSVSEIAQVVLMLLMLIGLSQDGIDTETVKKAATSIAALAGLFLLVQYFTYYLFDYHIQLVPVKLLLPESEQWILGAQTGRYGINGVKSSFYRPSAFFLEPSHLFMYSFPTLFLTLFDENKKRVDWIKCGLISGAIVLSTSGMGIAVVAIAWALFFMLGDETKKQFSFKNVARKRNLIMLGAIVSAVVVAIIFVPFVRNSVVRIFSSSEGSSAISGRTFWAVRELKRMTPFRWIIGVSDSTSNFSFNIPGFMAMAYKYGIIGIVLSYEFYVKSFLKLDIKYSLFAAVILVVSFFSAHTHGTFFMLYYVLLLGEGYRTSEDSWFLSETKPLVPMVKKLIERIKNKKRGGVDCG